MFAHRNFILLVSMLLIAALAAPAAAQKCKGGKSNYDPSAEKTVSGTVEKIDEKDCQGRCGGGQGACLGIHLWLATGDKTYEIHVGPKHFLDASSFELAQGDEVSIIGSPVPGDEDNALIARQINRDSETLTLRDEGGAPEWRGGRRGRNRS